MGYVPHEEHDITIKNRKIKRPIDQVTGKAVDLFKKFSLIAPMYWWGVGCDWDDEHKRWQRYGIMQIDFNSFDALCEETPEDQEIDLGMAFDKSNTYFQFRACQPPGGYGFGQTEREIAINALKEIAMGYTRCRGSDISIAQGALVRIDHIMKQSLPDYQIDRNMYERFGDLGVSVEEIGQVLLQHEQEKS